MSTTDMLLLAIFVVQVYNTIQRHAIINNQLVMIERGENTRS